MNPIIQYIEEQKQIGLFLRNLDRLITLHQCKESAFSEWKDSDFLQKHKTTWEQRKLCDVVKEITRNDPESEAPIMMITANNGFIEQSERYAFNNAGESLKKYILLKKGELAYNHGASKLRPYGSCFALTTAENARIPFVYHCFSAENQNAEFMSIELNGAEIENQLRKIVSSGARMDGLLNISFDEYTSVSVLLPGIEEQDCIADFFRQLDNLITLHQCKCDYLIRFEYRAFSLLNKTDWEQRKFGEMADYKKGPFGSALKKEIFVPKSEHSVKVYEQQNAINKNWKLERYFITKEYANELRAFETHSGDIIVSCAGTIGEMYELPDNSEVGVINQALMRVRVNRECNIKKTISITF